MESSKREIPKKKHNPIWKAIFIIWLLIHILIFGYVIQLASPGSNIGLGFIGVIFYAFIFFIIGFVLVLLYVIKQNPQGIAKMISYTALTVISLMLLYFGFGFIISFIPGANRAIIDLKLYFINIGLMQ
jgi:hypothetical protein